MKAFVTFLFFVVCVVSFGQSDTIQLKKSVALLDMALLQKDTATLNKLLHSKASYGHSNGWVETKQDVIKDLLTGYLKYEQLEASNLSLIANDDWASVRMNVAARGVANEKPFEMKLYVLQVWKKIGKQWQLISRQSAKL